MASAVQFAGGRFAMRPYGTTMSFRSARKLVMRAPVRAFSSPTLLAGTSSRALMSLAPQVSSGPQSRPSYLGRDDEAPFLVDVLKGQQNATAHGVCRSVVCLTGGSGVGKSALALDVANRILEEKICKAGGAIVDLQGSSTLLDCQSRICGQLSLQMGENMSDTIMQRLRSRSKLANGRVLIVLDNAEGVCEGFHGAEFEDFVEQLATECTLIITSRVPVACDMVYQFDVNGLKKGPATEIAWAISPVLSGKDAETIGQLCGGSPALIRQVAHQVGCGRLSVKDIHAAIAASSDQPYYKASFIALAALSEDQRQFLACLTCFPSTFDDEGAAAVMGWKDVAVANAALSELYNLGLLRRDPSTSRFYLQEGVRSALASSLTATELHVARRRHAKYILTQLEELSEYFVHCGWGDALNTGRLLEEDISAFLQFLKESSLEGRHQDLIHRLRDMDTRALADVLLHLKISKGSVHDAYEAMCAADSSAVCDDLMSSAIHMRSPILFYLKQTEPGAGN